MARDVSPGWYRWRGAIFGAIYLAGFFGGSLIWSLAGRPHVPFYVWLGSRFGPSGPTFVATLATLCVFLCWALRTWGAAYLTSGVVWNPNAQTNALLVDGPFRYVRNPLYLGNLFLALGLGAIATPCGFGIIVLGSLFFVLMLSLEEARSLRATHGAAFEVYARAVPALLPRLTPAHIHGSACVAPSLIQGLRAEIMTAALFAGMLLVVIGGERMFGWLVALWLAGWATSLFVTGPKAA